VGKITGEFGEKGRPENSQNEGGKARGPKILGPGGFPENTGKNGAQIGVTRGKTPFVKTAPKKGVWATYIERLGWRTGRINREREKGF